MTNALKVLKHKHLCGVLVALSAVGCAQRGPLDFSQKLGPEHDPSRACLTALAADPQIQPLAARLGPFTSPVPTIEMRASKDYATDDELRMISYWGQRRQACHDEGIAFRISNAPLFYRSAMDWQTASLLGIMAKLYARDFNYGQFISERERIANETRTMIASGAAQAQQADLQLRQAQAAEASAAWRAVQAMQPAPIVYPPVPIAPAPRAINCTTMPMGAGWTNTRCQ